jgi:hypothetical protein
MFTETEQPNTIDVQPWEAVHDAWKDLGRQYSVNLLNSIAESVQDVLSEALVEFDVPEPIRQLVDQTAMLERTLSEVYAGRLSESGAEWFGCEIPGLTNLIDQVKELTEQHAAERVK